MAISLYYGNARKNVGDYYSYGLCSKIFKQNIIYGEQNVDIISTGSVLASPSIGDSTLVCGSGGHNFHDTDVFHGKKNNVLGVRGKLTVEALELGNVHLGDPGLLIPKYYDKEVEKKFSIGLICHWKDLNYFRNKDLGAKIKFIPTDTLDIESFIDDVRSCKFIFSTSLHGIIFAHAYGIPAVHLEKTKLESKDNFKFKDYYSILDIKYKKIEYKENFSFITEYIKITNMSDYVPSSECLESVRKDISAMFSEAKKILMKRHNEKLIIESSASQLSEKRITKTKDIKPTVCLCAIAKEENAYLRDWVNGYRNLGFSKIYIYDNNDVNGEHFEDVIGDYIRSKYVNVIDVRGKSNQQIKCYNEFYHTTANDFDYVAFFDIDEFLNITVCDKIYDFVKRQEFKWFDGIAVNGKYFDDNNKLDYTKEPIYNRLTHESQEKDGQFAQNRFSKRILKTKLDLIVNSSHGPIAEAQMEEYSSKTSNKIVLCNSLGQRIEVNLHYFKEWTHEHAFLAHYRYKTIGEYIKNKMKKGYATLYKNSGKDLNLNDFFDYNDVTVEKLKYAAKIMNIPYASLEKKYLNYKQNKKNNSTKNKKKDFGQRIM